MWKLSHCAPPPEKILSLDPPPPHKKFWAKKWENLAKNGIFLTNPQDFHKPAVKFHEIF
jgi:hypothetical protein